MVELLFGRPPIELSGDEFKALIGDEKYQAHLNYFYGITVEQALHLAVAMEIEKEQHGKIPNRLSSEDVFQRIYGSSESVLLQRFRQESSYPQSDSITLSELNEFTYWLFKYRVENCDSSRLASDTRKALRQLEELQRQAPKL
jgi:predicted Zn-dependent peptidase